MKKGISIAIILVFLLTLMIPQTVFASSYIDAGGQTQDYKLFFRGGAEPAATDAINVYWGDFQTKGQNYLISWKKTEDTKWQQVEIEDPCDQYDKVKSYKIEGLLPNQDYDIKISAILLNEKGEKVYTSPIETVGHTYVTAPAYEAYSCVYSGDYVESIWQVFERNAVLKIYRAESQNGTYKYVGSTDGRETLGRANCKDVQGRVVFRDETALPRKSYYYKAVSEVKLADGTVMESESTRPYNLTSKNKPYGQYTTKLLNQRGTYAKTLTWKLVSDKANYKTVLEKNQFTMHSVYSTSGKAFSTKPVKVQYSYDGKKYTTMNKNLTLQPGKTIYIRIQLKNKLWIRKDGKGFLALANKYYYNSASGSTHHHSMQLEVDNKVVLNPYEDPGDHPGDDVVYHPDDEIWEDSFRAP